MMGERDRFPGIVRALGLIAALWLLQIAAAIALKSSGGSSLPSEALVWIGVGSTATVVALHIARRGLTLRGVLHPAPYSLRATGGLVVPAVLLVAPAAFIFVCFADDLVRLAWPVSANDRLDMEALLAGGPLTALAVVGGAPVFEELLFRGIILRGLLARMAPGPAIVVSALLFGIAHLDVYQLVSGALLGLPLGWLYVRFRSVLPCIALHAATNGLSSLIANLMGVDVAAADLPVAFVLASVAAFVIGARQLVALTRLRQSGA
jgi:hypothetical protein